MPARFVATCSIAAFDPETDSLGDDHPEPIRMLIRIMDLHTLYFGETRPEDVVDALLISGYVEEREQERGYLDRAVLEYMKGRG